MVRHPNIDEAFFRQIYEQQLQQVAEFESRNQSSWYFQANSLMSLAKLAYALGQPLKEVRNTLRCATAAYRELFSLRGQSFCLQTRYNAGKPLPEEKVFDDGYSSVDSFHAAVISLIVGGNSLRSGCAL